MKKVIYRLQFRFEETNKSEMRDNDLLVSTKLKI